MRSLIKGIKIFVLVFSLLLMGYILFRQWEQIKAYSFSINSPLFIISLFTMTLCIFLGAIGWHYILKAMGETQHMMTDIKIWALSSMTRYLPGGLWGHVSRAALCKEQGISLSTAIFALYLEIFLVFLASFVIGLPAASSITDHSVSLKYLFVAAIIACLLIHPRFLALIKYLPAKVSKYTRNIVIPSTGKLFFLYLYYLVFLIIYGIAFLLFVSSLLPLASKYWLVTASVFPLAFCIGFILIIFPSGIGIRESMIYLFMLNIIGPEASLIVSIGSRLWTILAEIVFLILVYILINRKKLKQPN